MDSPADDPAPARRSGARALPPGIWALGFVSLFMDMSTEAVHSLLPVFLVSTLGASTVAVGVIEGIAEATASITKVFSGVLSDYLGRRKLLTIVGYGLAALTKPLFPLASSIALVFAARFIDRVGKGIRGAPRDALIGDLAPPELRGAAYGLRQSLDTVGAFVGPLFALGLMVLLADDIRAVFWFAVLPAAISVAMLVLVVREPARPAGTRALRTPVRLADVKRLGSVYWGVVAVGGVLTLARFSEAFLVLRAENVGLRVVLIPLVMVVMSVVYAASAYPAGVLSDRLPRRAVLVAGFAVLIAADLILARAAGVWLAMAGVALWGLHMGLTQGVLASLVADAAPLDLRGTAFGLFNLATGVILLPASVLAGFLWERLGPAATFLAGAAFTAVALAGLLALGRKRPT
jgi:MFS family permease